MVNRSPFYRETSLVVTVHEAPPLQTQSLAYVTLSRKAMLAALALSNEHCEYMISHFKFINSFAYTFNNPVENRVFGITIKYIVCQFMSHNSL